MLTLEIGRKDEQKRYCPREASHRYADRDRLLPARRDFAVCAPAVAGEIIRRRTEFHFLARGTACGW